MQLNQVSRVSISIDIVSMSYDCLSQIIHNSWIVQFDLENCLEEKNNFYDLCFSLIPFAQNVDRRKKNSTVFVEIKKVLLHL